MPVPSLVTDLSTTAASNSPAGSDNVFPDLDNYLRALSAFVASVRDNSGNGWVSPYLALSGGTVSGSLSINGNTTLGDAVGDTITVNGTTTFVNANPTLSAGTANGVAYLNGSKVLTSGSALTFDGTNLGIGTTNPAAYGLVAVNGASASVNINATTGVAAFKLYEGAGTGRGSISSLNGSNGLAFAYGTTEGMRLDTSGNLGLGVTPSAWRSVFNAFDIGRASLAGATGSAQFQLTANAFQNSAGNWIYRTTDTALQFEGSAGAYKWYTAPSGTAGNAITFTQALTLDASGKLLVGLTSSRSTNALLQVSAPVNLQGYTVATLPAGTVGDTAYVTDATAPTFLGALTGGGAVRCPVFHNGTAWVAC